MKSNRGSIYATVLAMLVLGLGTLSYAQLLPNTGQQITPLAPRDSAFVPLIPGLADMPDWEVGQAATSAVSPDGNTLLVVTSGYNLVKYTSGASEGNVNPPDSNQYVFIYDISKHNPVQKQVIQVPNTYYGITFDPSGKAFYVPGGVNDNLHVYVLGSAGMWSEQAGSPMALGHTAGVGLNVAPCAAGVAIAADGSKLVVNYYNDSISVFTKLTTGWSAPVELDLRPGIDNPSASGVPGGEFPFSVVIKGNDTAYVSSLRDRQIVVVNIASAPTVMARISVPGEPNKMVLNASHSRLYAAEDVTDSVAVIDTGSNTLVGNIPVTAPFGLLSGKESKFKGNDTNGIAISKDSGTLYVTNGAMNDVAVVQLGAPSQAVGLIPTGWYPNSVSFSKDGKFVYVANDKSPTGPNPGYCKVGSTPTTVQCEASNQYDLQLIKAGLQSFPTPGPGELGRLTERVADNNHFGRQPGDEEKRTFDFLHKHIHHVIYIVRENRTYDQILGDLDVGNGDPSLAEFGATITPNQHKFANQLVDLDNFYDTSEVSMDGWPWSTSAHALDVVERQTSVEYAGRGLSYDSEGTNRNVNVGIGTLAGRLAANPLSPNDPNVLPGTANTDAPDGPGGQVGAGFLWDSVLRAGMTVRNYGFFVDQARYNLPAPYTMYSIPEDPNPYADNLVVAYPTSPSLTPLTDPYFRGFDQTFPDYYRFHEWQREFNNYVANGELPHLTLLRIPHDHTGNYSTALGGLNTPELDQADNDYALGLVAQTVAHSRYKDDTLMFMIEDDAQDGGDHVDAHRSIAFVIGPYVKHKAVVSAHYTTLSMYRTIEDILGAAHSNLNDDLAVPMTNVFDTNQKDWAFNATPSGLLCAPTITLGIPPAACAGVTVRYPTHNAAYWANVTKGMDFSSEDKVDGEQFNRILWKEMMGDRPYPTPTGLALRANRQQLLERYRVNSQAQRVQTDEKPTAAGGGGL